MSQEIVGAAARLRLIYGGESPLIVYPSRRKMPPSEALSAAEKALRLDERTLAMAWLDSATTQPNQRGQGFIDMTGQEYGPWKVLRRDLEVRSPDGHWVCQCRCGVEKKKVRGWNLRNNVVVKCRNCGIRWPEKPRKFKHSDMPGKEFDRWTVLRQDTDRKGQKIYWTCRCKCGQIKSVETSTLINHESRGCMRCAAIDRGKKRRNEKNDQIRTGEGDSRSV